MVLDKYVFSWYREISIHDQLIDEVRYIIRYAVAALATKLTKVKYRSDIVLFPFCKRVCVVFP